MRKIKSLIALLMMSAASPVWAQAQPAPDRSAAAAEPASPLADIVVTAQRRSESLSKTPVSVSVLSADQLVKAAITTEQDLRVASPGLGIRAGWGSNQLNYVIRGQSQDPFSSSRPGVLPYVNEVQINGTGAASAFYDLQSVQILKGPQGTLFGRSATGGAVLFTTVKPGPALGGYASGSIGNYGAHKLEGALNVPLLADQVLTRISGFYQKRDGFQHNSYDGSRPGSIDRFGLRGSLTVKFSDAVKDDLVVDYYHANNTNMTPVLSGILTPKPGSPYPYVPVAQLYGGVATPAARATGIAILQAFTGLSPAAAAAQYDAYFAAPHHPTGGLAQVLATQQATGPYTINSDALNMSPARNLILTNTTAFNLDHGLTIKNIFGYTHIKSKLALDADGSPYATNQGGANPIPSDDNQAVSNELQLVGKALDGRADFVIGAYFSDETSLVKRTTAAFDILQGFPLVSRAAYKLTSTTYAPYAQATYHLNDTGLAVTLGGRYTSEKVRYRTQPGDDNLVTPIPSGESFDQSQKFDKFSWTAGIQDQIDTHLLVYAASRRAYKSGGYNGLLKPIVGNADSGGNSFGAQRNTDIEVGSKFQGRVGSVPLRMSLAGFRVWVKGEQRTVYAAPNSVPSTLTVNVAQTNLYGAEFEGQIEPARWLTLGASANYLHSEFGSNPITVLGISQVYDQVPDSPRFSGGAFADVRFPLMSSVTGMLHGDVYRQSSSTISTISANNAGAGLSAYTLANFRAGIEAESGKWSLTANLKNAFQKVYYVGGLPLGQITGYNILLPGDPRTFTIEARVSF